MIKHKAKKCRGINKAHGFEGCGNLSKYREAGLCKDGNKCYYKWLNNTEKGESIKNKKTISFRPKKPMNKVSAKRKKENPIYSKRRKIFLQGKTCFIKGCNKSANSVEHLRGRRGYADEWARQNRISLFLDERFWAPCCLDCNLELENNPELSRGHQLSKLHGGKKMKKQNPKNNHFGTDK